MRFKILILVIALLTSVWLAATPARAADQYCFCASDLSKAGPQDDLKNTSQWGFIPCFGGATPDVCTPEKVPKDQLRAVQCQPLYQSQKACEDRLTAWKADYDQLLGSQARYQKRFGLVGYFIPSCLFEPTVPPECRDISIFVVLLINFGRFMFAGIGMWALVFFVYGGFVLITSAGNPERIKKGRDIMVAVVIGLFVAFAGYLLIRFMGEAIGIKSQYQLF